MISANLPPGTHLVCVDASSIDESIALPLVRGKLYTLRGYVVCFNQEIGVLLNGIRNRRNPILGEQCYRRSRFELPVLPRSLTKLLDARPTGADRRVLDPVE